MNAQYITIFVRKDFVEEVTQELQKAGVGFWTSSKTTTDSELKTVFEQYADQEELVAKLRRCCNDQQELIAKLRRRCAELREVAEDALSTCEYEGYDEGGIFPADPWEFPEVGDPGDG